MNKWINAHLTLAFLVIAVVTTLGIADAANISADFSTAANPNGVWTYGYSAGLGGTLINYDVSGTDANGIQSWHSSVVFVLGTPADFNNPTSNPVNLGGAVFLPAHTAGFHPGPNGEFSVYRFTTPTAGTYNLSAVFGGIDSGGTDVHVLDNGVAIFDANITGGSSQSFTDTRALALGETIDFAVGVGPDGNFFSDATSINASITPTVSAVPEPHTLMLLGVGFAGVGFVRRRQAK
jgi:hypothetical protein